MYSPPRIAPCASSGLEKRSSGWKIACRIRKGRFVGVLHHDAIMINQRLLHVGRALGGRLQEGHAQRVSKLLRRTKVHLNRGVNRGVNRGEKDAEG